MSLRGKIIEKFDPIIPRGMIDIDAEEHTFQVLTDENNNDVPQTVYTVRKAPLKRVESVRAPDYGGDTELTAGTDYQVIDNDSDGDDDSIEILDTSIFNDGDRIQVDYVARSVVSRYAEVHTNDLDQLGSRIDDAIESKQINTASGDDLDRVGALFGELGQRQSRTDKEYRQFIKSIVQSFNARGTKPGMKFAIAAGVGTDPSNVQITEDFNQNGYDITLNVNTKFVTQTVTDMADLSDPSGVELLTPPVVIVSGGTIEVETTETTVTTTTGLGSNTLTLDGNSTLQ